MPTLQLELDETEWEFIRDYFGIEKPEEAGAAIRDYFGLNEPPNKQGGNPMAEVGLGEEGQGQDRAQADGRPAGSASAWRGRPVSSHG